MKDKKIYLGVGLAFLLLMTISLSYAYFSASVSGNDNAKDVVVNAGTLSLVYTDGPEIKVENIRPGKTITKEVTVKNTGTLDTNYNIIWQSLINEITNDELVLSATCQRLNASGTVEGTCGSISQEPVRNTTIAKKISIESGITHKYTFTILFKDTNANQNYNQGKKFSGVLGIEEYKDTAVYCTYDGKLIQGATYIKGDFTYKYKQNLDYNGSDYDWLKISEDGWGVAVTNRGATNAIDANEVCTYINNKPIVSMNTMFGGTQTKVIKGLEKLNTSNVINMSYMFTRSQATTLDLRNFDTSNVTNMAYMFMDSQATTLDVSNFNTSKVTNMLGMFSSSKATTLDVSNFDTSNLTNTDYMFKDATNLKTIYASNKFTTGLVSTSYSMFEGDVNLVGGAGTTYDSTKIDKTYARIDGGTSNPGYFTSK